MYWSSMGAAGYAMGIARSTTGNVLGPWVQEEEPIWGHDGGHGMIARNLDDRLLLTLHQPNTTLMERAVYRALTETETTVVLGTPADPGSAPPE